MNFSVNYHVEDEETPKYVDIENDEWWRIDSRIFPGNVELKLGSFHETFHDYPLAFSANMINVIHFLIFYGGKQEVIHFQDRGEFLKLSLNDGIASFEFWAGQDEPLVKGVTEPLASLIKSVSNTHQKLLSRLFIVHPKILYNRKFMHGYPDAVALSQKLQSEGKITPHVQ